MEEKNSDVLRILENIKSLSEAYKYTTVGTTVLHGEGYNDVARKSLVFAMTTEAAALAVKLRRIRQRWEHYMPYCELLDVDISTWIKTVKQIKEDLRNHDGWYEPKADFFTDFHHLYPKETADDTETAETMDYINLEVDQYSDYYDERKVEWQNGSYRNYFDDLIGKELQDMYEQHLSKRYDGIVNMSEFPRADEFYHSICHNEEIYEWCEMALDNLVDRLNDIYKFNLDFKPSKASLKLLAERYIKWYFPVDRYDQSEQISKLKTCFDNEAELYERANECYQEEKNALETNVFAKELEHVINLDSPKEINYEELGNFIYWQRKKYLMNRSERVATRDDIDEIIGKCIVLTMWYKEVLNYKAQRQQKQEKTTLSFREYIKRADKADEIVAFLHREIAIQKNPKDRLAPIKAAMVAEDSDGQIALDENLPYNLLIEEFEEFDKSKDPKYSLSVDTYKNWIKGNHGCSYIELDERGHEIENYYTRCISEIEKILNGISNLYFTHN